MTAACPERHRGQSLKPPIVMAELERNNRDDNKTENKTEKKGGIYLIGCLLGSCRLRMSRLNRFPSFTPQLPNLGRRVELKALVGFSELVQLGLDDTGWPK